MHLFFRKYGEAGPPIIILHGLYGASDNWVSIAKSLSDRFQVYAIDQRNHGNSPHSEIHSYKAMQSDLTEFMDEMGIEKATFLGHSMGGKTAMHFCSNMPERVISLIVIDIAPISYIEYSEAQGLGNHAKMMDAMLGLDLEQLVSRDEVSKALEDKIPSERVRRFLLKNLTRDKDRRFKWKINLDVLRKNLTQIMDGLDTEKITSSKNTYPTLFIKGASSNYIQLKDFDSIHEIFPKSNIITIPNAGHWIHSEQPRLLVKNINYFLENI